MAGGALLRAPCVRSSPGPSGQGAALCGNPDAPESFLPPSFLTVFSPLSPFPSVLSSPPIYPFSLNLFFLQN